MSVRVIFRWPALILWAVAWTAGCGRLETSYGPSDGYAGDRSINGFGAFRDSIEQHRPRLESRNVYRLSNRTSKNEAIVWIPDDELPFNDVEVIDWLDDWLDDGGKTLVFIVPDGGSTDAYWELAADLAPPAQSLEYRRRFARQVNERLMRDAERNSLRLDDWFRAKPLDRPVKLDRYRDLEYELTSRSRDKPKQTGMGPNSASQEDSLKVPAKTFDSLMVEEAWTESGSASTTQWTTLARVTKPDWRTSQVLIVAGGSLLTNFAMTQPAGLELSHEIAERIDDLVAESERSASVGFLRTNAGYVPVSRVQANAPGATGLEVLTTWPLSLISIHMLFLGLVLCLMLLPIFGRPRRVRYNRATQFGNHLDAMAKLMMRSGSRHANANHQFAKERISRYLRRVRGETSGPWVLPEAPSTPEPTMPVPLTDETTS